MSSQDMPSRDTPNQEAPSQERSRASPSSPSSRRPVVPGAWLAALIAALSGGVFAFWVRSQDAPGPEAGGATARISEVPPDAIDGALGIIAVSPEQLERFRAREACARHLAWVVVMRAPGQPAGHIRLQSGGYISPVFDLTETPVRVALPYPAPYPSGQGTLTVLGTTADAIVALTPPQPVPAQAGPQQIAVRWTPSAACPTP